MTLIIATPRTCALQLEVRVLQGACLAECMLRPWSSAKCADAGAVHRRNSGGGQRQRLPEHGAHAAHAAAGRRQHAAGVPCDTSFSASQKHRLGGVTKQFLLRVLGEAHWLRGRRVAWCLLSWPCRSCRGEPAPGVSACAWPQVHPQGLRHIRADRRINEWRAPGRRAISRTATNARQVCWVWRGFVKGSCKHLLWWRVSSLNPCRHLCSVTDAVQYL